MEEINTTDKPHGAGPETVLVSRSEGVLTVVINRPEQRNALSRDCLGRISRAFSENRDDPSVRLAVLTGAGDRAFAAGGDLKELMSLRAKADVEAFSREARAALETIRAFPAPVVAALNGKALGGGAELALACDFRVASDNAGIGFLQGKLALTTAWGGGIDLMRLIGPARALDLLLSGRIVAPGEARAIGLVDAVAEEGETMDQVLDRFLEAFAHNRPQVARGFKALAAAYRKGAPQDQLEAVETRHYTETWLHEDHWTAAEAAMARIGEGAR